MSIDVLQQKIRKLGNPLMVDLIATPERIPQILINEHEDMCDAYDVFCRGILSGLKGKIPAVRFRIVPFFVGGDKGNNILRELTKYAASIGFYVVLDFQGIQSAAEASFVAQMLWGDNSVYFCDAVVISAYAGSDIIKPFLPYCEKEKKDVFVAVRTPNKSASEVQDLLAGSRMVHMAAADYVNRYGTSTLGKFGYSRVGILAAATAGDSVRMLRTKYPQLFMIVDGMDSPGANAKSCSYGFDKMGHGAIISVGEAITTTWAEHPGNEEDDYVACAVETVDKLKKRSLRYIDIM